MKELDQLREIYVAGVDDETRAENEEKIREWEQSLLKNEALASWQQHDITKEIIAQAKRSYVETSMQLLNARISHESRAIFFAQRDAMIWLIQLASDDPKTAIEGIQKEIRTALNATN